MVAVRASTSTLDDAELAQRAKDGDREAFGLLFERWFDRAFDVAWHIVRNRDTAAEVTQEAFAAAWQQVSALRQPESFGGWLLRIARNKGLNRLERDRRTNLVGDEETMETLDPRPARQVEPTDPVIARERDDMVWVAATALGPDDASLLNLHLRHELGPVELAEELGVQPNAVHQRLFRLKKRLGDAIGAWVLWHGGEPSCPALRTALAESASAAEPAVGSGGTVVSAGTAAGSAGASGTTGARFSRPVAAAIVAHVAEPCEDCAARRQLQLSPEALFAAVPIVVAGPLLRARAAAALESAGVPAESREQSGRPSSRGRSGLRGAAMAAGAAAAVVISLVALAERAGDGSEERAAVEAAAAGSETMDEDGQPSTSGSTTTDSTAADEAASTTEPADPDLEPVPPGSDPVDEPTTGTTPTTASTLPGEPEPEPTIGGFRATLVSGSCRVVEEVPVVFTWSSSDATSATLGPRGGPATSVEPSGTTPQLSTCGTVWVLTVTGPGGTATATATVR